MSDHSRVKSDGQNAHGALLKSFAELAKSRRYSEIGVGLIVQGAKVARSTFYYYFKEKDDLLLQNLQPMISALAKSSLLRVPTPELDYWLSHIWDHRANARRIFDGTPGKKIANALTEELLQTLRAAPARRCDDGQAPLQAAQIAGSILSLLQAWVSGRGSAEPTEIAALIAGSRPAAAPIPRAGS